MNLIKVNTLKNANVYWLLYACAHDMGRRRPKTPEEMQEKYEDKIPFFADYFEHKMREESTKLASQYLEDYKKFRWDIVDFVRQRFANRPEISGAILVQLQNAISELVSKWNRRISMGDKVAYLAKACAKLGSLYRLRILTDDDIAEIANFVAKYGVDRDMFLRMFRAMTGAGPAPPAGA